MAEEEYLRLSKNSNNAQKRSSATKLRVSSEEEDGEVALNDDVLKRLTADLNDEVVLARLRKRLAADNDVMKEALRENRVIVTPHVRVKPRVKPYIPTPETIAKRKKRAKIKYNALKVVRDAHRNNVFTISAGVDGSQSSNIIDALTTLRWL
jgi:hypothetical protein